MLDNAELFEQQDRNCNGALAEKSLLAARSFCGNDVELVLHDYGSSVAARLTAVKSDLNSYLVKDLQIPTGNLSTAMVRMSDTIALGIDFDKLNQQPFPKSSQIL